MSISTASFVLSLGAAIALPLALWLYRTLVRVHPLSALPGPPSSSLLFGNGREFVRLRWDAEHAFPEPFTSWMRQYGSAFHYRVLFQHRVAVSDPEAIRHILVTNVNNYPRHSIPRALLRTLLGGDGLLSSEDPAHSNQRKLLHPQFAYGSLKTFVASFVTETKVLQRHLETQIAMGNDISVPGLMTRLTINIIGATVLGYDFKTFDAQHKPAQAILQAFEELNVPLRPLYILGLAVIPGFQHWPLPYLRQIAHAKATLFRVVDDVVAHKMRAPTNATDLLDLMLDGISPEEARVHVMTFMFAGHETTSNTLCWVLAMLAIYPEVERQVVAECAQVTAHHGGELTWDALGELPYLTAVIHETLRLFPTVPLVTMRESQTDDYVPLTDAAPFFMPKGGQVTFTVGAIHRNPQYWSQPDVFLPDRFVDGTAAYAADKALREGKGNTFFYLPFSAGVKNCIGKRFAIAEMQTVLALLIPKYAFMLTPDANLHPKLTGVTIKPTRLRMTVRARVS
ncbi:hypothetical protein ACHHYP_12519 [Achlya hypogyna]|uniref:Cytochrome P450 n=1 Tax=Achlya hypogyna TaxID=1202772 RepID=A0A1V9YGT9_ACHHY|nr:hypothetical protein ACHHYP_12519 [Achlya hypogyna]